jgi:hypothetical protein
MTIFHIPVPAASIQTALNYGIANTSIISNGVSFDADGSTVVSSSGPTTYSTIDYAFQQANTATIVAQSAYNLANTIATIPSAIFDGGGPDTKFSSGPILDFGGII